MANPYVAALMVKIPQAATNGSSRPPMAGPMTRDRFICTDCSDTAPGRSRRGTSVGRTAVNAGALRALPIPMASTLKKTRAVEGWDRDAAQARTSENTNCSTWQPISSFFRSMTSAKAPPTMESRNSGPSWANPSSAT